MNFYFENANNPHKDVIGVVWSSLDIVRLAGDAIVENSHFNEEVHLHACLYTSQTLMPTGRTVCISSRTSGDMSSIRCVDNPI